MAAVATAAEQKCASVEAAMREQGDIYKDEIACLTSEIEQVSSKDSLNRILAAMRPALIGSQMFSCTYM